MKHRPIVVTLASAAVFASTFMGSGFAMANATTSKSGPTTAPQAVGQHAAADALAVAALLRSRGGGPGGRPGATAGLGVITGVVDADGGRPVVGACVIATGRGGGSIAMTRPDGRYVLASLRPGRYTPPSSGCAAP